MQRTGPGASIGWRAIRTLRMTDEKDQALKDLDSIDGEMKEWAEAFFRDIAVQHGKRSGT